MDSGRANRGAGARLASVAASGYQRVADANEEALTLAEDLARLRGWTTTEGYEMMVSDGTARFDARDRAALRRVLASVEDTRREAFIEAAAMARQRGFLELEEALCVQAHRKPWEGV